MHQVSVAEARRRLRSLLAEVAAGKAVAVLRRGKEVARLVPPRRDSRRLPRLGAFRRSVALRGGPLSQDVIRERRAERY